MKPREIRHGWSTGNSSLLNGLKKAPLFLWLVFPIYTFAGESVEHSWENLKQLRVGQKTEV